MKTISLDYSKIKDYISEQEIKNIEADVLKAHKTLTEKTIFYHNIKIFNTLTKLCKLCKYLLFAKFNPTSNAPIRPGAYVTAIASILS